MSARQVGRGPERIVGSFYRMTAEEKQQLRDEADALGFTAQQLFELRMFGRAKSVGRAGPRPKGDGQQELIQSEELIAS